MLVELSIADVYYVVSGVDDFTKDEALELWSSFVD